MTITHETLPVLTTRDQDTIRQLEARLAEAERLLGGFVHETGQGDVIATRKFLGLPCAHVWSFDFATASAGACVHCGAAADSAPACKHGGGPLCGACEAEMMAGTDDSANAGRGGGPSSVPYCERCGVNHPVDMGHVAGAAASAAVPPAIAGPYCPDTRAPCERMCQTICNRRADSAPDDDMVYFRQAHGDDSITGSADAGLDDTPF